MLIWFLTHLSISLTDTCVNTDILTLIQSVTQTLIHSSMRRGMASLSSHYNRNIHLYTFQRRRSRKSRAIPGSPEGVLADSRHNAAAASACSYQALYLLMLLLGWQCAAIKLSTELRSTCVVQSRRPCTVNQAARARAAMKHELPVAPLLLWNLSAPVVFFCVEPVSSRDFSNSCVLARGRWQV